MRTQSDEARWATSRRRAWAEIQCRWRKFGQSHSRTQGMSAAVEGSRHWHKQRGCKIGGYDWGLYKGSESWAMWAGIERVVSDGSTATLLSETSGSWWPEQRSAGCSRHEAEWEAPGPDIDADIQTGLDLPTQQAALLTGRDRAS